MDKVLIVGAGAQGGPCASVLSKCEDVSEIILGDIDLELAKKIKAKTGSNKITPIRVDAGNIEDIIKATDDVDVIINLRLTAFNSNIMKAALEKDHAGFHALQSYKAESESVFIRAFRDALPLGSGGEHDGE